MPRPTGPAAMRPPEVEPQHREIGESGEARSGLPDDVGIHEPPGRGERVQRHEGADGGTIERDGELAHEGEAVAGAELDVAAPGGEFDSSADLDGAVGSVGHEILQQWVCQ
nr:hypothetical protein GCM10025699_48300 [Microbacterium flavescens]